VRQFTKHCSLLQHNLGCYDKVVNLERVAQLAQDRVQCEQCKDILSR
jgi:hypothetical protein